MSSQPADRDDRRTPHISHISLDSLPAPVLLIDHDFRLVARNRAAGSLQCREGDTGCPAHCFAFLRGLDQPCRVPVGECPVRFYYEAGEAPAARPRCCDGRLVTPFDAGDGLVGLLIQDQAPPDREEQRTIHSGKLAALGAMLTHIVHNLNSTFYVAGNYLGVLRKKLADPALSPEIAHCLQMLEQSNRTASEMAATLLDYTRKQASRRLTYPHEAVEEVLRLLESATAAAGINPLIVAADDEAGPQLDRQTLLTALFNVIQNAIEAMPEGGELRVELKPGLIAISDQGRGIPPALLERVFEPYFTTSDTGTGLGLFIVRRMMLQLGGEVRLTSKVGSGTTVELRFPPAPEQPETETK